MSDDQAGVTDGTDVRSKRLKLVKLDGTSKTKNVHK